MPEIKIKFLSDNIKMPEYATEGSAGMDLSAAIKKPVLVRPGERTLIPAGIALQIPKGYAGFVFARSGLALRQGLSLCNGVGVIDSDYTGEIKIGVVNLSNKEYTVNPGDRVAQLVIMPVACAEFTEVDELERTARGGGGFGSTGK